MSIYSELLTMALEVDRTERPASRPTDELIDELVARHVQLARSRAQASSSSSRAELWTADLIAHDVALIRLCQRLGIEQALTDPLAPPSERERLLSELAANDIQLNVTPPPAQPSRS